MKLNKISLKKSEKLDPEINPFTTLTFLLWLILGLGNIFFIIAIYDRFEYSECSKLLIFLSVFCPIQILASLKIVKCFLNGDDGDMLGN